MQAGSGHDWRAKIICLVFLLKRISCIEGNYDDYTSSEMSHEGLLLSELISNSFLEIRPSSCSKCDDATLVNVSFNIIQVLEFKESEESVKLSGWFTFTWMDYRLRWNPSDYGNCSTTILPNSVKVWKPDIGIMNSKERSHYDFSSDSKHRLKISANGLVIWQHAIVTEVTCPLDVSSFPFDTQECFVITNPWQSSGDQIKIFPHQIGFMTQNQLLHNVSEWSVTKIRHTRTLFEDAEGADYTVIQFGVTIQRRPLFYLVLVVIPFGILSFLACLIFALKEASDRLSVALSILLSMTMYVVIVSSSTPRSMRTPPAMCFYLLSQMILLSLAILWSLITSNMEDSDSMELPQQEDRTQDREHLLKVKRRRITMDCIGLVIYLLSSLLNGVICLTWLP